LRYSLIIGVDVSAVDYMECHATGTQKGDVVEAASIRQVINPETLNPENPKTRRNPQTL
jgi:acyl transferase domain-containing protein